MGLWDAEERVVVVCLIGFVCEDGVGQGGVEEGSNGQNGQRTEAHVRKRRGGLEACFLTFLYAEIRESS